MENRRKAMLALLLVVAFAATKLAAEPVLVRHLEGVTFGFLVLRNLSGETLAHGVLKQVVRPDDPIVMADLQFHFKDGSFYREITKFTQRGTFRLVSDEVLEKGPSFKQDSESWVDAETGKVTVRMLEKDKKKSVTKHLDLPNDAANGLLFTIAKNIDPTHETVVSMAVASTKPRVVKLQITPAQGKTVRQGPLTYIAQHYIVQIKVPGAAGVVAPLLGKQPPNIHLWVLKSEAPTFIEFEGPLSEDTPVWRIELAAPEPAQAASQSK